MKRRFFNWLYLLLFSQGQAYRGPIWYWFAEQLKELAEHRQIAQEWLDRKGYLDD